ncbi:unnamed protein product, partial [Sphagnum compactum]
LENLSFLESGEEGTPTSIHVDHHHHHHLVVEELGSLLSSLNSSSSAVVSTHGSR